MTGFDENTLPRRFRFGVCFSIAIIGACPNENFVSRDLAIPDYSDRLLDKRKDELMARKGTETGSPAETKAAKFSRLASAE